MPTQAKEDVPLQLFFFLVFVLNEGGAKAPFSFFSPLLGLKERVFEQTTLKAPICHDMFSFGSQANTSREI